MDNDLYGDHAWTAEIARLRYMHPTDTMTPAPLADELGVNTRTVRAWLRAWLRAHGIRSDAEPWQRLVLGHENSDLIRGPLVKATMSIGLNMILERGKLGS